MFREALAPGQTQALEKRKAEPDRSEDIAGCLGGNPTPSKITALGSRAMDRGSLMGSLRAKSPFKAWEAECNFSYLKMFILEASCVGQDFKSSCGFSVLFWFGFFDDDDLSFVCVFWGGGWIFFCGVF